MNKTFDHKGSNVFETMTGSLSSLTDKMSLFGLMGFHIMDDLAQSAVRLGERIVSALSIDGMKDGFMEYELKMDNVKTLMNQTGRGIGDVNSALDELNEYSDKTIYNFAQMTSNAALFAGATGDLDMSTKMVRGMANLAAYNGVSNEKAQRGMYMMSQAMNAGKIQLYQWRSMQSSSMANKKTEQDIIETARQMGIAIDDIIAKRGSFRESLQDGWFTSKVWLAQMEKYTSAEKTQAEVIADMAKYGITIGEEQATAIIKQAQAMEKAATEVTTFSKLMDTTTEAIGSGWAQTFQLIIGDYEQAKKLWTSISNVLSGAINNISEHRNKLLEMWQKAGGRDMLISALGRWAQNVYSVLEPIGEAFRKFWPQMDDHSSWDLMNLTRGFSKLVDAAKPSEALINQISGAFENFFGIIHGVQDALLKLFQFDDISGPFTVLDDILVIVIGTFRELLGIIRGVVESIADMGPKGQQLHDSFKPFFEALHRVAEGFRKGQGLQAFKNFFGEFDKINMWAPKMEKVETVIKNISKVFSTLKPLLISLSALGGINLIKNFGEVMSKGFGKFFGWLDPLGRANKTITETKDAIVNSAKDISKNVKASMFVGLGVFAAGLGLLMWGVGQLAQGKNVVKAGLTTIGLLISFIAIAKSLKKSDFVQVTAFATFAAAMGKGINNLGKGLKTISEIPEEDVFRAFEVVALLMASLAATSRIMQGGALNKEAGLAFMGMAFAIRILTKSLITLSVLDPAGLGVAIVAIAAVLFELAAAAKALENVKMGKTAGSMILFGVALIEMAAALKLLSTIPLENMGVALFGLAVALGEVAAFMLVMQSAGAFKTIAQAFGIVMLSAALIELSLALKLLSSIPIESMGVALFGLAVALGEVAAFSLIMGDAKMLKLGGSMILLSTALIGLSVALKILSTISLEDMGTALVGLGGALLELSVAMTIMRGSLTLQAGASILMVGLAMVTLAASLKVLSTINPERVGSSLILLGGAMAILVASMVAMSGVTPALFAFAASMATLAFVIVAVTALLSTLATNFDTLHKAFADFDFAAWAKSVAEGLPEAVKGFMGMIDGVLMGFAEKLPEFIHAGANVVVNFLIGLTAELPRVVDAGFKFIITFIQSMADGLDQNGPQLIAALNGFVMSLANFLLMWVADLCSRLWEWINSEAFGQAMATIGQFISGIISGFFNWLGEMFVAGSELINQVISGMAQHIYEAWSKGGELVQGVLDGINSFFTDLWNKGGEIVQKILDGIKEKIDSVGNFFGDIFGNLFGGNQDTSGAQDSGGQQVEAMAQGMESKQGDVEKASETVVNKGVEKASQIGTQEAPEAGENFSHGIANGIESGSSMGWIEAAARRAARRAKDAAKRELDERSPSKEGEKIGAFFSVGMANGVTNMAKSVYDASGRMAAKLVSTAQMISDRASEVINNQNLTPKVTPVLDLSEYKNASEFQNGVYLPIQADVKSLNLEITSLADRIVASNNSVKASIDGLMNKLESVELKIQLQPQELDGEAISNALEEVASLKQLLDDLGKGVA
jgi:tape measure domain-containing protein